MINNKKVICIIQARINSTRLPRKIMLPISETQFQNYPIIHFLYDRIKTNCCPKIDQIIIATGEQKKNKELIKYCLDHNLNIFIGQEKNVFNRVLRCAQTHEAKIIVEITGDCPFVPTEQINYLLNQIPNHISWYASNVFPYRTYPDGFDIQIYPTTILDGITNYQTTKINKEHVGWNLMTGILSNRFTPNLIEKQAYENLSHWGLTLDTEEDYKLITSIMDILFKQHLLINTENIINLLKKQPELLNINSHIKRKVPNESN